MGLYKRDGSAIADAAAVVKTAVPQADPQFTITNDVFQSYPINGAKSNTAGKGLAKRLLWHAGQKVRQSEIDKAFQPPTQTL